MCDVWELLFLFFFTDLMPKILRAILKTKDYVEANGERLDKIESYMYNSTSRNQNNTNTNSQDEVETENMFGEYFPIVNEDSLDEFERKLSEWAFRLNVVSFSQCNAFYKLSFT